MLRQKPNVGAIQAAQEEGALGETSVFGEAADSLSLVAPADLGVVEVFVDPTRTQTVAPVIVVAGADGTVGVSAAQMLILNFKAVRGSDTGLVSLRLTRTACTRWRLVGRS